MGRHVVEQESVVPAPIDEVWARVVTPEGINDELSPWLSMTMPAGTEDLTVDRVPLGEPLGRAWLRLFGVVPVDYDHLSIVAVEPGRRFHERSTMLSAREWEHERTLSPLGPASTVVHDRVTVVPRTVLSPAGPVVRRGVAALFAHRHRRLAAHFR